MICISRVVPGAVEALSTRPRLPGFNGVQCQWARGVWAGGTRRGAKNVARSVRRKLMPARWYGRVIDLLSRPTDSLLSVLLRDDDASGLIFVDRWRRRLLEDLLPLVRELQRGLLRDQESCGVVLGHRGVGKTAFVRALLVVAMLTADARMLTADARFVVVTITCKGAPEALAAPVTAVHAALKDMAFEALTEAAWERVDEMNTWLVKNNVRVLIAVDDVEYLRQQRGAMSRCSQGAARSRQPHWCATRGSHPHGQRAEVAGAVVQEGGQPERGGPRAAV